MQAAISWLLFSWRFGVKIATLQLLSLLLVVVSMLWVCNAIQGSLSLFNMLGALLVVALAIDYLVFYQINKLQPKNILAISLSAASSMWVFGMLSASSTPAIFSFGLTVMVGILAVYILSPLSVLPFSQRKDKVNNPEQFDVVAIGAGPSGALASSLLVQKGSASI